MSSVRRIPPTTVTGVHLAQGLGVQEAKGFWADAWSQVLRRPGAVAALGWLGLVGLAAVFSPLIANGHPLIEREIASIDGVTRVVRASYPLFRYLTAPDIVLLVWAFAAAPVVGFASSGRRSARLGALIYGGVLAGVIVVLASLFEAYLGQRELPPWARSIRNLSNTGFWVAVSVGVPTALVGLAFPVIERFPRRLLVVAAAYVVGVFAVSVSWGRPLEVFDYTEREARGEIRAVYTLVPWSANQRFSALDRRPPMTTLGEGLELPAGTPGAERVFVMGTDAFGQDVLTQVLAACRLAVSIGLVSTGIATLIGVTLGALMGYFGGWVDLALYRVVEVFMAVPLLFLLIVAAGVLPPEFRSTYVMMGIIGCFTWTGAARFTRAEFLKLRHQDFVQAGRAMGLPLRSILFRHMLPNGVTPVLVDASFAIAAAITIEATLSYLGLGPVDQASWGKLLASAVNAEGQFKWWLAVFPGVAIFLTVLSYNLIGEALRDAIDPKLKKARV
jgi:peptide/nickel transport system permease protein